MMHPYRFLRVMQIKYIDTIYSYVYHIHIHVIRARKGSSST